MSAGFLSGLLAVLLFVLGFQGVDVGFLGTSSYEWWVIPIILISGFIMLSVPFLMTHSSGLHSWFRKGILAWFVVLVAIIAVFLILHYLPALELIGVNIFGLAVAIMATLAVAYRSNYEKTLRIALLVFVLMGSPLLESALSSIPLLDKLHPDTIHILVLPLGVFALYAVLTYILQRLAR